MLPEQQPFHCTSHVFRNGNRHSTTHAVKDMPFQHLTMLMEQQKLPSMTDVWYGKPSLANSFVTKWSMIHAFQLRNTFTRIYLSACQWYSNYNGQIYIKVTGYMDFLHACDCDDICMCNYSGVSICISVWLSDAPQLHFFAFLSYKSPNE